MRWFLALFALGCAPKATPADPGPPAPAGPTGELHLVESWPLETTLDHADIADAADEWVRLINGAALSVDLGEFYVSTEPGSALEPVLESLRMAAARGVEIRLLADAKFAKTYPQTLAELDALEHVEVRHYDVDALTGGVLHAKYFVVDGRVAYVGSQNFDWRSLSHVQELGFTVDEPHVVEVYEDVFALDWAVAGGATLEEAVASTPRPDLSIFPVTVEYGDQTIAMTPLASPSGLLADEGLFDLPRILELLASAKTRVRVQLLSFETVGFDKVEWTALFDALKDAAGRGVAVEIILADWSKSYNKLESAKALQQVDGITVKFCSIPEWSGGFVDFARVVHAKYLVVDGTRSWIGTSNWSHDYFYGSRNVGMVADGAALGGRLDAFFEDLWTSPYVEVVDPAADYHPPRRK